VNGLTLDDGTKWQPFLVPEPQDMKSHQLCMGVRVAAKGLVSYMFAIVAASLVTISHYRTKFTVTAVWQRPGMIAFARMCATPKQLRCKDAAC
jgi:hypothetical protein